MNSRQQAFVAALVGPANGIGYRAAIRAGYSPKTARQQASRLLTKAHILRAIQERQRQCDERSRTPAAERDRILSEIARDELATANHRISAIIELNRCSGRHAIARRPIIVRP